MRISSSQSGFSLVELLIALLTLSTIATFTIPKVVMAQQYSRNNAAAKQVAAMLAAAYDSYKTNLGNPVPANATLDVLLPYLNYVRRLTSGSMDDHKGGSGSYDCSQSFMTCLKLHNGGVLFWTNVITFAGTGPLNGNSFIFFDPDGVANDISVPDGPGKSVCFVLYYSGRITSRSNTTPGTINSTGTYNPNMQDPSWFSW